MTGHTGPRNTRASRIGLVVAASTSALALIAGAVALGVVVPDESSLMPLPMGEGNSVSVQQTVQTQVCPAQMALIDTASYGDEAFRTTSGNIATHYRVAVLGGLVAGQFAHLNSPNMLWDMATDTKGVQTFADTADDTATILQAMLTKQQEGYGIAGSAISSATEGDLRGTSAMACGQPELTARFLLPSTKTGYAQQLVLTNTAAKPTTVHIRVHGTSSSQALALNTESAVTVNAQSNQVMNLSAAAPNEQGVYVEVTSDVAPVFAHVRIVAMDGLTPKGSEQVASLASDGVITSLVPQLATTASMYSEQSGTATWYWIDERGEHKAKTVTVDAGTVTNVDLGKAPDGVVGAVVRSKQSLDIASALMQTMDGEQQSDFMMASPSIHAASSAIALPQDVHATLHVVNGGTDTASATLTAYNADGKEVGSKKLELTSQTGASIETQDIAQDSALLVLQVQGHQGDAPLQWSATVHGTSDHQTANLAQILPTALEPSSASVALQYSQRVVS